MCGLAGFFDRSSKVDPERYGPIIEAMTGRIAHRGPDDAGLWCDPASGIALGFRRLAILDLSPAGHQPMESSDGRFMMAYNGEIYNHLDLRAELTPLRGTPWRSTGDSEVLLEGFVRWGVHETLSRLDGMFAIALWDRQERRLWLARDRFGEKPLYYGFADKTLLFGSELKALKAHPAWRGAIDRPALGLFLAHGYVPAPYSAYEGIGKLPPGHVVSFTEKDETAPRAFWDLEQQAAIAAATPFTGDLVAATDRLEQLIDESVASRLESDVPVGAFLSGGIDSSTVVAAMQRARPGLVRSFSIGFPGTRYDEAPFAEAVARHLGTRHLTLPVTDAECRAIVPRLPQIYDEPFADASAIPTLLLCELTRAHVTVGLSGDGGDELFGGYERYPQSAARWQSIEQHPLRARIGRAAAASLAGNQTRVGRTIRKRAERWSATSPEQLYRDRMSHWQQSDRLTMLARPPNRFDAALPAGLSSLAQRFAVLDAVTYLPDDLLVKMDRASMAVGLEARAPLLNAKIAAFAWSLPPSLAIDLGPKRVLREVLYRRVPRALIDRPKQGFEPPIGDWLRGALRDWADDLLSPAALTQHGLVDPALVARRWREHRDGIRNWTYPLWTVLMAQAWL
jgi:asparagine synthase (glutamine-hydrolysing)